MKKISVLSLFVMAAFVSQAWGVECKVNGKLAGCQHPNGCWALSTEYTNVPDPPDGTGCIGSMNTDKGGSASTACTCDVILDACRNDGQLYTFDSKPSMWTSGTYGGGQQCASNGGTLEAGGNQACGFWCKWETGCKEIKTDINGTNGEAVLNCNDAIAKCDKDAKRYDNSTCSGTPIGGTGCNKWCKWTETGACTEIKPDPSGQYGPPVANCTEAETNCEAGGTVFTQENCGGSSPIKFTPASKAFIVAPFGRSLHISSPKDATVSLYDMSGAKVYSGKVRAGNSVFSLEKVATGSYYAVVQSGSDAKKVPVILK